MLSVTSFWYHISQFDWNAWFSAAYDNTEYTMNNEQIFIVQSPSYFRNLSGIIQSTNNTWVNYIIIAIKNFMSAKGDSESLLKYSLLSP